MKKAGIRVVSIVHGYILYIGLNDTLYICTIPACPPRITDAANWFGFIKLVSGEKTLIQRVGRYELCGRY